MEQKKTASKNPKIKDSSGSYVLKCSCSARILFGEIGACHCSANKSAKAIDVTPIQVMSSSGMTSLDLSKFLSSY